MKTIEYRCDGCGKDITDYVENEVDYCELEIFDKIGRKEFRHYCDLPCITKEICNG